MTARDDAERSDEEERRQWLRATMQSEAMRWGYRPPAGENGACD
jgi:hypothetical protein